MKDNREITTANLRCAKTGEIFNISKIFGEKNREHIESLNGIEDIAKIAKVIAIGQDRVVEIVYEPQLQRSK